jgi:hypothetical protein
MFYLLGIYPYWIGVLFWAIISYLSATLKPPFGGILCLSAVFAYNYGLIQKIMGGDDTLLFIERLWQGNKLGVIIFTTFYAGGQLFIVSIIAKRNFAKSDAI